MGLRKGGSREETLGEGHCLLQGEPPALRKGPQNPLGPSRKGQQGRTKSPGPFILCVFIYGKGISNPGLFPSRL